MSSVLLLLSLSRLNDIQFLITVSRIRPKHFVPLLFQSCSTQQVIVHVRQVVTYLKYYVLREGWCMGTACGRHDMTVVDATYP